MAHSELLQNIIEDSDFSFRPVCEYFIKMQKPGSATKAVISQASIKRMHEKLRENSECISLVIRALEEFSFNFEVEEPWIQNADDVADLLKSCIELMAPVHEKNDMLNLRRLCEVLMFLGDLGDPLSSKLFNVCAPKFLISATSATNNVDKELRAILLSAICSLCRFCDLKNIIATYESLTLQLFHLAALVHGLSVEAQVSAYCILWKVIDSKEIAEARAANWFPMQPSLRTTFVKSYSKPFSQGCGEFVNELFKLSHSKVKNGNLNHSVEVLQKHCVSSRNLGSEGVTSPCDLLPQRNAYHSTVQGTSKSHVSSKPCYVPLVPVDCSEWLALQNDQSKLNSLPACKVTSKRVVLVGENVFKGKAKKQAREHVEESYSSASRLRKSLKCSGKFFHNVNQKSSLSICVNSSSLFNRTLSNGKDLYNFEDSCNTLNTNKRHFSEKKQPPVILRKKNNNSGETQAVERKPIYIRTPSEVNTTASSQSYRDSLYDFAAYCDDAYLTAYELHLKELEDRRKSVKGETSLPSLI